MKVRCDHCHITATVKRTNFPFLIDEHGKGWEMIPPDPKAPISVVPEPLPQDNEQDARTVKAYFFICDACNFNRVGGNYKRRINIMP